MVYTTIKIFEINLLNKGNMDLKTQVNTDKRKICGTKAKCIIKQRRNFRNHCAQRKKQK